VIGNAVEVRRAPEAEEDQAQRGFNGREETMAACDAVIDLAGALFDVSGRDLRQPGRTALATARVRQIAMYVTHVTLGIAMGEIGRCFGRDRTTVVHACHLIEDMRDDEEFDRIVSTFERVVRAAFDVRGSAR
jgi:chromosomal replication initiation ATPase DnaA